jgi:RNA polymerase sigma-70 factor (ECF subfamily)
MESSERAGRPGGVTQLLQQASSRDRAALEQLFRLLYRELRRLAEEALRNPWDHQTLSPAALVQQACLKLTDGLSVEPQSRLQLTAIAARALRQVLVDWARRRLAQKRGAGLALTTLTGEQIGFSIEMAEMPALDAALTRLDRLEPRLRKVVEYRFFGGLSGEEIAGLLGVSERTIDRDWVRARAWLYKELYPEEGR